MPLPDNGQTIKWPPESMSDTYRLMAEWDAWYSGDPERLANFYASLLENDTPQGKFWGRLERNERRTMLHVPLAGDIAGASADLLFSEPPRIYIPGAQGDKAAPDLKEAQVILDEFLQQGNVFSKLLEGAETAAAIGGVYLTLNWDQSLVDRPILTVVQADHAVPSWRFGILTDVAFWRVLDASKVGTANSAVYRHLELHEVVDGKAVISNGLYRGTADKLGLKLDLAVHPDTAGMLEVITTEIEGLDVRYVPNMMPNRRVRGSNQGQSDYSGGEGLMDALDETYTSWLRDIRLGVGRIMAPAEFLESTDGSKLKFNEYQEVFLKLEMDALTSKGTGLTINQFAIRFEEHEATANNFMERIISNAGYSPQSFGLRIDGRAESGTALRVRERKSFTTQGKKQQHWLRPIADLMYMALVVYRTVFNRRVDPVRPVVEPADSVTYDPAEVAKSVDMIARAKAASTETLVRMVNPDWNDVQIQSEVERIHKEQGIGVPDPLQIGMS